MTQYLYKKESYEILGAAMDVYNEIAPGFLEAIYHEALEIELADRSIPFESRKTLTVFYRGQRLAHQYQADVVDVFKFTDCPEDHIAVIKTDRAGRQVDIFTLEYLQNPGTGYTEL